jgi:hypothetical protein
VPQYLPNDNIPGLPWTDSEWLASYSQSAQQDGPCNRVESGSGRYSTAEVGGDGIADNHAEGGRRADSHKAEDKRTSLSNALK